jgi:beta-ureidopropionase / N-carbamoyl-L-amino-acid hydrolase
MEAELRAAFLEVLSPLGLAFEATRIWSAAPVQFSADLIDCVRKGAAAAGFATRDMISGAGHDACYISRVAPTTMIFVPCAGGISHNEAESTEPDECAAGAQVLLNAVLEFDRRLG